jgi:hypothetical protein
MTLRRLWPIVLLLALLIGGVLVLSRLNCRDEGPSTEGPIVVRPDREVVKSRPQPPKTLPEKILRKKIKPTVVVSRGTPDSGYAMRYARAAFEADSLRRVNAELHRRLAAGDTTARPDTTPKVKRVLPPVAGSYTGTVLRLWLTRSDGSLYVATVRIKPHWQFWSGYDRGSDSVPEFSADRWFVRAAREVVHCAPWAAGGSGLGALVDRDHRVRGAVLVGGAVLLGCLVG